jgi:hypothetical protein
MPIANLQHHSRWATGSFQGLHWVVVIRIEVRTHYLIASLETMVGSWMEPTLWMLGTWNCCWFLPWEPFSRWIANLQHHSRWATGYFQGPHWIVVIRIEVRTHYLDPRTFADRFSRDYGRIVDGTYSVDAWYVELLLVPRWATGYFQGPHWIVVIRIEVRTHYLGSLRFGY